jgi:hypothetical protein
VNAAGHGVVQVLLQANPKVARMVDKVLQNLVQNIVNHARHFFARKVADSHCI